MRLIYNREAMIQMQKLPCSLSKQKGMGNRLKQHHIWLFRRWRPTVYKITDRKEDHGTYKSSGKEKDDPNNLQKHSCRGKERDKDRDRTGDHRYTLRGKRPYGSGKLREISG